MNEFTERYNSKSNIELLNIIKNPRDFKPLAVQAAKDILDKRQLTPLEIESNQAELTRQLKDKEIERKDRLEQRNKLINKGLNYLDPINPLKSGITSTERTIRAVIVTFGFLSIYSLFSRFGTFGLILSGDLGELDFSIAFLVLQLLLPPLGIILFYLRKPNGWIILSIMLTMATTLSILNLIMAHRYQPVENSLTTLIDSFAPSLSSSLWAFVFNGSFLYALCRENIREQYSISRNKMYLILGIVIVAMLYFFGGLL